jgi:hypothetical protein
VAESTPLHGLRPDLETLIVESDSESYCKIRERTTVWRKAVVCDFEHFVLPGVCLTSQESVGTNVSTTDIGGLGELQDGQMKQPERREQFDTPTKTERRERMESPCRTPRCKPSGVAQREVEGDDDRAGGDCLAGESSQ